MSSDPGIGRPVGEVPVISRDEVAHLARLARLSLTEVELDRFSGQLASILGYVNAISRLSIDEVPAMASPHPMANVFRDDVPTRCLTPEQALAAAPAVIDGRFMVPQILEEQQ